MASGRTRTFCGKVNQLTPFARAVALPCRYLRGVGIDRAFFCYTEYVKTELKVKGTPRILTAAFHVGVGVLLAGMLATTFMVGRLSRRVTHGTPAKE